MFNIHIFNKKVKMQEAILKEKKKYLKLHDAKKKRDVAKVGVYRKRVETFVMNMLDNPVIEGHYKPKNMPSNFFRPEDSSKFQGKGRIIIKGFLNEKQRINETVKFNRFKIKGSMVVSNYDFRKPLKRYKGFEQEKMHFKEKTALERIITQLQYNRVARTRKRAGKVKKLSKTEQYFNKRQMEQLLQQYDKEEKSKHKFAVGKSQPQHSAISQIVKRLMPGIHDKTHFKAAVTLGYKLPSALYTAQDAYNPFSRADKKKKTEESFNETSPSRLDTREEDRMAKPILKSSNKPSLLKNVTIKDPKSRKKDKSNQKMGSGEPQLNNYETARRIVHKCRVIKTKSRGVKELKKGAGFLIPFPQTKNRDVYKEVYQYSEEKPYFYGVF